MYEIDISKLQYKVKWKGYEKQHNSWVIEEDMKAELVTESYWKKRKQAMRGSQ
jgi:hypothetical protein